MRKIARIPSGPYTGSAGRVVCCDSDHDSLPEVFFYAGKIHPSDPLRHEVWEHQGWNRLSLVHADTGVYPPPPGITTGNAIPFAAGDVDDDGLTDVVCISIDERDSGLFYNIVMTIESPDSFSYPCSLSWYYRYANNMAYPQPTYYPPDLDQDGHKEITMSAGWIWENTGNNQNTLVWLHSVGYSFTFSDFNRDGRMSLATCDYANVSVYECTGDDQYQVAYQDNVGQTNGTDVFMTRDIDRDSLPEFYVAFENVPRGKIYLYMWEADQAGTDVYHRTLVDSVWFSGDDWGRTSEGGDIDGDGIDECIWTTPTQIRAYKSSGDDTLQEVWRWYNDHGGFRSLVSTVYDINNDGYNELITAGNAKISIFEVDAVDLLTPNGGSCSVGDTVPIRWRANMPPACDSLSLFLRRDSLWNLDAIATGLPPGDTLYRWSVPTGVPETARVVVIAYGPGWQFDMSDSVIAFAGGGVAEGIRNVALHWSLSVSPNPARGAFSVCYDVPCQSRVSVGVYDAGGRLVRSLSEGELASGRYEAGVPSGALPTGIYFLRLDTPGFRAVKKAVVAR